MRTLTMPLALAALIAAQPVLAASAPAIAVTLKNHHFWPASLTVPSGVKVRINLDNQDAATEEFDSHDLNVEEVVTPHGHASFDIGPLKPGRYAFMGEFHPATAQGQVTVR